VNLYHEAVEFMHTWGKRRENAYTHFIVASNYRSGVIQTPDGVDWLANDLDYPRLDEMMRELV